MASSIFDARSPRHAEREPLWRFVRDVYTGGYLPRPGAATGLPSSGTVPYGATSAGVPSQAYSGGYGENPYVPRRSQAESPGEYAARLQVLDPDMMFGRAVGSLAGQIAAAEGQIMRTWTEQDAKTKAPVGNAFGSVDAEDTLADQLWKDADGEGTPWPVLWRRCAARLILFEDVWHVVSGVTTEDVDAGDGSTERVEQQPRVQHVEPWAVTYVREAGGRPVVVHVLTKRAADSLAGREKDEEVLTIYTLSGWTRRVRENGASGDGEVEDSGAYTYYEDARRRRRCLPIYRVSLGLDQYVSYLLARKSVARLNLENRRDSLVNKANTPRLVKKSDAEQSNTTEELVQGNTYHQIGKDDDLDFIEPGTAGADLATRVLTEKEKAFRDAAYQTYEDQAVQATATEVRQESTAGPGAFLTLVSGETEGAENRALWLLAQAHGMSPKEWGIARVQRSTKFVAQDEAAVAEKLVDRLFGPNALPVDETAQVSAAKRFLDVHGVDYDDEALKAAVAGWGKQGALSQMADELFAGMGDGQTGEVPEVLS